MNGIQCKYYNFGGRISMSQHYIITDKSGNMIREGDFTEPEMRMVAKAGYRVFAGKDNEITPSLTGLFNNNNDFDMNEFK
jgi:hypothetical protein